MKGRRAWRVLLAKSGDLEEAQAVWSKAAAGKSQSFRVFLAMDNLLSNGKPLPVLEITEGMLRADPQNWEALYRQGLALEQLGRPKEAAARFQKLIDLPVGDDEKSELAKAQAKNPRLQASGASGRSSRARGSRSCRSRTASAILMTSATSASLIPRPVPEAIPGRRPTSDRPEWRRWAGW